MENNNGQNNNYQSLPPKTDDMAIASLVLGIVSIVGFPLIHLLTIVCAVLAIVFANVARKRIYESGNKLTGIGMANAGMILGIICIAFCILTVAACSAFLGGVAHSVTKFY